ncbi:MAG: hypothetical protein RIR69_955, partial [Actinomycetota bacterium]
MVLETQYRSSGLMAQCRKENPLFT